MLATVTIAQRQMYEGEDWWRWAVWVEAPADVLDGIEAVQWILHPSFPKPIREERDRSTKFRLETAGWGTFTIIARVKLKSGEEIKLRHHLELSYPDEELSYPDERPKTGHEKPGPSGSMG